MFGNFLAQNLIFPIEKAYLSGNWLISSLYILFSLKTHINIYLQQLTTLHGTFSTRDLRFSDDIFENSDDDRKIVYQ
jgi:hypothetical protein